ncbi:hypothetical protein KLP42_13050 [Rhizobium sp. CSW-27]|nr:hypothetical protein [Rhizobium sp. CSW-27]
MSAKHLDPAKSIIAKIGIEKVSAVTGKHISRVYRWMYPKDRGGTGGMIPQREASVLLAYARERNIDLIPAEFFVLPEPPE